MFSPMEGKGEKVERKQGGRDIDFFPPPSLFCSMISSAARTQKICEGMTVLNVLFTDGGKREIGRRRLYLKGKRRVSSPGIRSVCRPPTREGEDRAR